MLDTKALLTEVVTNTIFKTMSPVMKRGILLACVKLLKNPNLLSFDRTESGLHIAEWHNAIGHVLGDFVVIFKVEGGRFNVRDAFLTQFIREDDEYDDE